MFKADKENCIGICNIITTLTATHVINDIVKDQSVSGYDHVKGRKILYNVVWSHMSVMLKLVRTINLHSFETDIAIDTVEHA